MTIRWQDLPEYRAPVLLTASRPSMVWQAVSVINFLAAIVLTIAIRREWVEAIDVVQRFWLFGGVWFCAAGAWWSWARTRNVGLLEGRLPTGARSIRAWIWPPLWVVVASLTIMRLEPTEPVDVRRAIVIVVFVIAAWRPISLIRRIFTSLSRRRFDELVVSLGAIQIVTWLVLWWHAVEVDAAEATSGSAFQGVAAASALSFGACAHIVRAIDAAASRAEQHRVHALQTREEHRYARSLGLNPFDSHVFDELVQAKLERELHLREAAEETDSDSRGATSADAIGSLVTTGWHRRRRAMSPALTLLRNTRQRAAARLASNSVADEQSTTARRTAADRVDIDLRDGFGPLPSSSDTVTATAEDSTRVVSEAGVVRPDAAEDAEQPVAPTAADEPVAADDEPSPHAGNVDSVADDGAPIEADEFGVDRSTPASDAGVDDTVALPGFFALESARLISLASLVAIALCFGWGVIVALDPREPIRGGVISARDLMRLDRVRDILNIALAIAPPLQTMWARVASTWAHRAGCSRARPRRCGRLAIASVLFSGGAVLGIVGDVAPSGVALLLVLSTICAWLAIMSLTPVAEWADSSSANCRVWATGQILVTLVHVAAGGAGDIADDSAVEWLLFLGVALGLITAVSAVVASVLTLDIEDSVRSSSRAARWVAGDREVDVPHFDENHVDADENHVDADEDDDAPPDGDHLASSGEQRGAGQTTDIGPRTATSDVVDDDTRSMLERPSSVGQRLVQRVTPSARLARLAMGASLILLTFAMLWVTLAAVDLTPPTETGLLAPSDVTGINRAQDWSDLTLTVALTLQVWWVAGAQSRAHLVGIPGTEPERSIRLLAATAGLVTIDLVLQIAVDVPSFVRLAVLAGAFGAAWLAVRSLTVIVTPNQYQAPLVRWWARGLVVMFILYVAADGAGDIEPSSSPERVAWIGCFQTLVTATVAFAAIFGSRELSGSLDAPTPHAWRRSEPVPDGSAHEPPT